MSYKGLVLRPVACAQKSSASSAAWAQKCAALAGVAVPPRCPTCAHC